MTKLFIIMKTGYSAGVYGCSAEYFKLVVVKKGEMKSISFQGMYGPEERVAETLRDKGFKQNYCPYCGFGKITGKDKNLAMSETEALEWIKKEI